MTLLNVGFSHHTASLDVLERYVLSREQADKLAADLARSDYVDEALVVTTCNRVEVYADTERFHAGIDDVTDLLARHCGADPAELTAILHVRYDEAVVAHAFTVAAGLDSMAVGETEILGQMRAALRHGQDGLTVGPVLNGLIQHALRVGKRVHAETELDGVARSLVDLGFALVAGRLGDLAGTRVLVVGAGSMAALSTSLLARTHHADVLVVNRTPSKAQRLAVDYGATAIDLADLAAALDEVDLVVSCTGAPGSVLRLDLVGPALARRDPARGPLALLDLGMPRDLTPEVAALPGTSVLDLRAIAGRSDIPASVIDPVRAIVGAEVDAYADALARAEASPTVAALRSMAGDVVELELGRLWQRAPELTDAERAEVQRAVHRVVEKLLHTPTVRAKELRETPAGSSYADALRELFALDPTRVGAITHGEVTR